MPMLLGEMQTAIGEQVAVVPDATELMQTSYDELLQRVVDRPSDEEAQIGMSLLMQQAVESGEAAFVMRNAMLLGAMACTDPHFETLANEAMGAVDSVHGENDGHGHNKSSDESTHAHDAAKCKYCRSGKPCSKK